MNKKTRAKYVLEEMEKLFPDSSSELRNWET
ncbi:TPA: endonuclease III, partial [Citrobacter freundii]|nr:endonuclease III [Citrobacter freundii]